MWLVLDKKEKRDKMYWEINYRQTETAREWMERITERYIKWQQEICSKVPRNMTEREREREREREKKRKKERKKCEWKKVCGET